MSEERNKLPEWSTCRELAARWRQDESTIQRKCITGAIVAMKTPGNGPWRIHRSVIQQIEEAKVIQQARSFRRRLVTIPDYIGGEG